MSGRDEDASSAPDERVEAEALSGRSEDLAALAASSGIRRVHIVAWRDLDDPEAGGSEIHAHEVASRWADAGIEVSVRTSAVTGRASSASRNGYSITRRSGRYRVFPSTMIEGARTRVTPGDALVEVWNGMPFLSPLWFRGPRVTFLHHVHEEMWQMVLPGTLGRLGDLVERRVAPPFYRGSAVITLSDSSRQEIIERLRFAPEQVSVVPPGIDARFVPGVRKSSTPLVVAVGRLVPVKRFDLVLHALAEAKLRRPDLRAVIVGEGYERPALEALRHDLGADDWIEMPGHLSDTELVESYQRAWLVASASKREGWGMTLTEAAACGTPAVATNIAGHRDAVLDGHSGILVDDPSSLGASLAEALTDAGLRDRLSRGALQRARWFNWDATALLTFEVLAAQAAAQR